MTYSKFTFNEYIDELLNRDYDLMNFIDELYWDGGCNTGLLYEYVTTKAIEDNVVISDLFTVDFDKVLYDLYQSTEKGLS